MKSGMQQRECGPSSFLILSSHLVFGISARWNWLASLARRVEDTARRKDSNV